jgi:predicted metal-dependent hydrolase
MPEPPPRYAPAIQLPPYAFVSPAWPHPTRDPRGHSYGAPERTPPPLDPAAFARSPDYLFGADLFNRGYYWEAHEAWEGLWHAAGREGPVALLLEALIKLAAAGVKVRQGQPRGVRIHAEGAAGRLRRLRAETGAARFAGVDLDALAREAEALAARAEALRGDPRRAVEVVFDFALRLEP